MTDGFLTTAGLSDGLILCTALHFQQTLSVPFQHAAMDKASHCSITSNIFLFSKEVLRKWSSQSSCLNFVEDATFLKLLALVQKFSKLNINFTKTNIIIPTLNFRRRKARASSYQHHSLTPVVVNRSSSYGP